MILGLRNVFSELKTFKRVSSVLVLTGIYFVLFILLIFPQYSYQMFLQGFSSGIEAFVLLYTTEFNTNGIINILLPLIISVLVGVTTVYTASNMYNNYKNAGGFAGGLSSVIAIFTAGCASCGVGILSLFGYTAGLAFLPFDGLEVQLLVIVLLLLSLEYSGRNVSCKLPV